MSAQNKEGMNKKVSEMSYEEIRSFMKPLGIPGLPYPMAKLEKNSKGFSDHNVGAVHSSQNPMIVYSAQSAERVNGQLFRSMPTPSMMFMLRDMLTRMAPESNNCLMTIFGDASAGKTYMFYQMGDLVHPEGALKVDCGGMNMHELFFRTVIDYGQGVKEQLEMQAANGKLQQSSIDLLNDAFPGAVIEKDGKALIDWEMVGKPKADGQESWADASARSLSVLELVYSKQGISVQTNSFGIKAVPGDVFKAWETGRPLILDEFNKSKRGTLDTFQTFLQFLNGEKGFDTFTAHNPLAESSDNTDCPKSITLSRKDRKLGWFVGIAGNDSSDGDTTQELSVSMLTRLNPLRIGEPKLRDWEHRLSQIYTGLPVTTLYNLFGSAAASDAAGFGEWLVSLRKLGLNEAEVKAIPPHEIHFLQNYPDTIEAITKMASYYDNRLQLSDTESALHRAGKYSDVQDEVAANGQLIHVSFRKAIADFDKALLATPEVVDGKGLKLDFNMAALFSSFNNDALATAKPGWHRLGENLARVIQEDIANDAKNMNFTHAALLKICEQQGIIESKLTSGGKKSGSFKTVGDLLKYEEEEYLLDSAALLSIRNVLIAALKSKNKKISGSDDVIIPLSSLNRAMVALKEAAESDVVATNDNDSAAAAHFIVPNDDLNSVTAQPLLDGSLKAAYFANDNEEDADDNLVDYRMALAGFAVPEYGAANFDNLWPVDLEKHMYIDEEETAEGEDTSDDAELVNTLKGKSKYGFNITFVEVAGEDGKSTYLSIIEDKRDLFEDGAVNARLVIGTGPISAALHGELAKANITYLQHGDDAFRQNVNNFIIEGSTFRAARNRLDVPSAGKMMSCLFTTCASVCSFKNDIEEFSQDDKFGDVFEAIDMTKKPSFYNSILKAPAKKANGI